MANAYFLLNSPTQAAIYLSGKFAANPQWLLFKIIICYSL